MMRYFGEFNRVNGDNIRAAAKRLTRMGLRSKVLPHKTALEIKRPRNMPWGKFTGAICSILQPRRGSVMMSSEATGRTFICSNMGNRPGQFQRM
jgi:hypothetical protein